MKRLASLACLFFSYIFVNPGIAIAQGSVETDRAALVALYDATTGYSWNTNTNWKSDSTLAQWHGVSTDTNGRVIEIRLNTNRLIDNIPAELGSLAKLERLFLDNNKLTGSIPVEFGNLTELEELFLSSNQLTGSIPVELGNLTELGKLFLDRNQLTGSIPVELGNLIKLEWLNLYQNELAGSIPVELGNLTKLEALFLSSNQLTGSIPVELGNLAELRGIDFNNNQLAGSIPVELGNLTKLDYIYLSNNQLTGEIPGKLENLTKLRWLVLSHNQLTGEIPVRLGNLTNLERLSLDDNQLTSSIPVWLGNLTELEKLFLGSNQLTGEIPGELGDLTNLKGIHLSNNQLTGEIPVELGNLTKLEWLYLDNNQLTGAIPVELENLPNLGGLYLANNQLTGIFPSGLCRISKLTFSGNPSLIVNCFGISDEFMNNERKYFEIAQNLDPLIIKNVEFILLQENSYGRLWVSIDNFLSYNISTESLNDVLKYVFSSTPADSTKGVLEYSRYFLGNLRKNYTRGNDGKRILDILCHRYNWHGSGRAFSFYNAISITGVASIKEVERMTSTIGHEYVHNINFSYAYSHSFWSEGLAEWTIKDIIFDRKSMPSYVINNWNLQYRGLPLFPPRPFSYPHANLFVAYIADRVGVENIKHIIQVCRLGGICDPDNPDNGNWYHGIDGLDYALSLLDPDLNLMNITLDFHTTNFINDSSVNFNGVSYGYESIIYAHSDFKIKPDVIIDFVNDTSLQHIIKLQPGGVDYILYKNTSDLYFSIDTNDPQITLLRLFKEKGNTKELVDIDTGLDEFTVAGDYDRVTLIAVHGNPREDQPDLTLNISATQNYGLATGDEELPTVLALKQNYPNPFNPETVIEYELPQTVHVRLVVYDITGRTVAVLVDGNRPRGRYTERFNAEGLSTGTYIYRLTAGGKSQTQMMTLVR